MNITTDKIEYYEKRLSSDANLPFVGGIFLSFWGDIAFPVLRYDADTDLFKSAMPVSAKDGTTFYIYAEIIERPDVEPNALLLRFYGKTIDPADNESDELTSMGYIAYKDNTWTRDLKAFKI